MGLSREERRSESERFFSSAGGSGVAREDGGAGVSCLLGNDAAPADAFSPIIRLVKGFFLPAVAIIVLAGSLFAAGAPCLGDVVCDDGGAIDFRLGKDGAGAPCLGEVVCGDGGATDFSVGKDGEPCLGDDD